jgi:hypothetical protein
MLRFSPASTMAQQRTGQHCIVSQAPGHLDALAGEFRSLIRATGIGQGSPQGGLELGPDCRIMAGQDPFAVLQ